MFIMAFIGIYKYVEARNHQMNLGLSQKSPLSDPQDVA